MSKLSMFLTILKQVGPIVLASVPATAPLAPFIVKGIAAAELVPGATSAQKKAAALAIADDAAGALRAGGIALDPQLTQATVSTAIDTVVGVVNQVHVLHAVAPSELPQTGATDAPAL